MQIERPTNILSALCKSTLEKRLVRSLASHKNANDTAVSGMDAGGVVPTALCTSSLDDKHRRRDWSAVGSTCE